MSIIKVKMGRRIDQHGQSQVQQPLKSRFAGAAALAVCLALGHSARAQTTKSQPQDTKTQQESLGDVARRNRPKDAKTSPKRVWTTDDFESAGDGPSSVDGVNGGNQANPEDAVREFRSLDQEQIGTAVLKQANAPDVAFPDRKDWEQRLFEAKQAWIEQVARVAAHKDANKDVQDEELRLATGAQRNFYRIANEGIEKARAVNDPILKAHLEYQRRLESCKSMSGDLYMSCVRGADEFKWQMQRDGSW